MPLRLFTPWAKSHVLFYLINIGFLNFKYGSKRRTKSIAHISDTYGERENKSLTIFKDSIDL